MTHVQMWTNAVIRYANKTKEILEGQFAADRYMSPDLKRVKLEWVQRCKSMIEVAERAHKMGTAGMVNGGGMILCDEQDMRVLYLGFAQIMENRIKAGDKASEEPKSGRIAEKLEPPSPDSMDDVEG